MTELDDLVPLTQAVKFIPGRPHVSTIWRWATQGVGNPPIRLETSMVGGRRFTSRQAVERFVEQLSGGPAAAASVDDASHEDTLVYNQLDDAGF